jgi:hypothetical protein
MSGATTPGKVAQRGVRYALNETAPAPIALDLEAFPHSDQVSDQQKSVAETVLASLEQLAKHSFAVCWLRRPSEDLVLVPGTDPKGLFHVLNRVEDDGGGAEFHSVGDLSQLEAFSVVFGFCREAGGGIDVALTDRRFLPFDHHLLLDNETVEVDREQAMGLYSAPGFVTDEAAIFPGMMFHFERHPDRHSQEFDFEQVQERLYRRMDYS